MSLKAFHFVFIVASILMACGFAVWSFQNYAAPGGVRSDLVAGIVAALAAGGLVAYECYFLRKFKNVSFI